MTWYCFVSPPVATTWDTPGTASRRFRTTQSAVVFRSMGVCLSDVSAMNRISPMTEEMGAMTGLSAPGGSEGAASCSFSPTIWRAWKMSVPQSNSTQTMDRPTAEAERTRRTPGEPLSDVSTGKAIWASTSSGAMPCASVMMVTVGAVRSGKTSTGMRAAE